MIQTCNIFLYFVAFVTSTIMFVSIPVTGYKKWTRDTYPNPYLQPRNCSRITQSYVCDPDKILKEGQADKLDVIIWRIRNETACLCEECPTLQGITIAIALMETMSDFTDPDIADGAGAFATHLRQKWNFGNCDDDVVLFVSSVDQKFYASVGSAVANTLDKNIAVRIFQVNRDHFITGYYYQGLESIMESYYDVLREHQSNHYDDQHTKPSSSHHKDITVALVVSVTTLIALLIFIIVIIYRIKKTTQKVEETEGGNSLARWHASKNNKSSVGDYEHCSVEDHCDDDDSSEGSSVLSEIDSEIMCDAYQMNRMYNITKRHLSAVPEESENEDDENNATTTSSLRRKSSANANGTPRIPQLQDSTEE